MEWSWGCVPSLFLEGLDWFPILERERETEELEAPFSLGGNLRGGI